MTKMLYKFIFGCFILRLTISILAKNVANIYLKYMGYIAIIPAIGFIILFITGLRTGGTGAFNNNIWWDYMRPIHAILFLSFSYLAIRGNKHAYLLLLLDSLLGLLSFLNNHNYISIIVS